MTRPHDVYVAHLERNDPRLGRHVVHDPASRGFALADVALPRAPVLHERHAPIFDQGQIGSCTANAALGMLVTGPLWRADRPVWTETDALALYHEETVLDEHAIPGVYPPDDTGSAGIFACKALRNRGLINGYRHAFSADTALGWIARQPIAIGIPWYTTMFDPDPNGVVRVGGTVEGGHEVCVDGIDPNRQLVRFANSWGAGWGDHGWGWLSFTGFRRLLHEDGDAVTVTLA